jgi:hypothetical protein
MKKITPINRITNIPKPIPIQAPTGKPDTRLSDLGSDGNGSMEGEIVVERDPPIRLFVD